MKKIIVAIFTCLILMSLITPAYATVKEDESQKIILIDPGHGGIDGGAKSQSGTIDLFQYIKICFHKANVMAHKCGMHQMKRVMN